LKVKRCFGIGVFFIFQGFLFAQAAVYNQLNNVSFFKHTFKRMLFGGNRYAVNKRGINIMRAVCFQMYFKTVLF